MMKSAKTSKNPTISYKLKGSEFEQFLNYETFLSLVKAYTNMRFIVCDKCKCNARPPSSIVEGTSSFQCEKQIDKVQNEICKKCLYPYGRFVNQDVVEVDECFQFPRKITNDPCLKPEPPPCPPPCPPCCLPCDCAPIYVGMRACCVKQTKPKGCKPARSFSTSMKPCCSKKTKPCSDSDSDSEKECGNPLLKCANLCK